MASLSNKHPNKSDLKDGFTLRDDFMKAYVITTGAVFGLLTVAHIWRGFAEPHLAKEPWFILFTLVAFALSLWAWRLLMRSPGS
jgi:hypothetical protein